MERVERGTLAVLVGAAVWAFARSPLVAAPWLALAAASVFFQLPRVSDRMLAAGGIAVRLVVGVVVLLGWILMAYPVLSAGAEALVTMLCGHALALLTTACLLSPRFPRARTLYPAVAALLALACYDPEARVRGALLVAALALGVLLASAPVRRWTVSGGVVLALHLIPAFLIARWIVGFLPVAQTKVEEYGMGMLASNASTSGMSTQVRLGELARLKLSSQVVLRVFAPAARKLRGRVYVGFDGRGWKAASNDVRPLPPLAAPIPAGELAAWSQATPGRSFGDVGAVTSRAVPSRILQRLATPGLLVAPGGIRMVRAPVEAFGLDAYGLLRPPLAVGIDVYGVVTEKVGEEPDPSSDPALLAACLALPADTDPRIVELARSLAAGLTTAHRLDRTVSYVASACRYSLEPGAFRTKQPVAEFLFEKKRGYCEYFASAAAVLLRLQGVPTRYVSGYNVLEGNRQAGHYVVREADSHAWIEAYLPERGWVEADPTPAAEYEALHAERPDFLAIALEWVKMEWAALSLSLHYGDWRSQGVAGGMALGLVVLAMALRIWLSRRRGRASRLATRRAEGDRIRPELRELLARVDGMWARAGHPRPASRAPLEHALSLPAGSATPELREVGLRAVECYYRERFGGVPASPAELEDLSRRVA